jgi:hypothetical protein
MQQGESRPPTGETKVKWVKSQTAWIADSDGVINSSDETNATNSIAGGTLRENDVGWTGLKQRMQTHRFLKRDEYKT